MNKMLFNLAMFEENTQKAEYDKLLEETNGFNGKPKKEIRRCEICGGNLDTICHQNKSKI